MSYLVPVSFYPRVRTYRTYSSRVVPSAATLVHHYASPLPLTTTSVVHHVPTVQSTIEYHTVPAVTVQKYTVSSEPAVHRLVYI